MGALIVIWYATSSVALNWLLKRRKEPFPHDAFLELVFTQRKNVVDIIGFGSLMSPLSARGTFPSLFNFQLVRVCGYRRVFAVPGSIFFDHGIADLPKLRIAGLTTEKADGHSFLAASFTIKENYNNFLCRENTYDFAMVPFEGVCANSKGNGLMCISSSDDVYISRWGRQKFNDLYASKGVLTIWNWSENSGLEPCWVYLRHCVLSARALSPAAEQSFLDDTYLIDRKTTIREYLRKYPEVMDSLPPASLVGRYSG